MDTIHRLCLLSSNKHNSNDDASISESRIYILHVAVIATSQSALLSLFFPCKNLHNWFTSVSFWCASPSTKSVFCSMQELCPLSVKVTWRSTNDSTSFRKHQFGLHKNLSIDGNSGHLSWIFPIYANRFEAIIYFSLCLFTKISFPSVQEK